MNIKSESRSSSLPIPILLIGSGLISAATAGAVSEWHTAAGWGLDALVGVMGSAAVMAVSVGAMPKLKTPKKITAIMAAASLAFGGLNGSADNRTAAYELSPINAKIMVNCKPVGGPVRLICK